MSKLLLLVPPFWDPVCVPLGAASLNAYAKLHGHASVIFDFNSDSEVFGLQKRYFSEVMRQFPKWGDWAIQRNGTEVLALHQLLYLRAYNAPNYPELCAEILNVSGKSEPEMLAALDVDAFDLIFDELYARITSTLSKIISSERPDVIGCSLYNSTWPATTFLLALSKQISPTVRTVVGGPGPSLGMASQPSEITRFLKSNPAIDYYVVGEGERALVRILADAAFPTGIVSDRELANDGSRLRLSALPDPDYGDLDVGRYLQLSVASSRGCPFECTFCAETVFWRGFRAYRKSEVFDRIHRLATRYGRHSFYVCDSLTNHLIDALTIQTSINAAPYRYDCYLRPDQTCVDEAAAKRWFAGGLRRARLGMETGSQRLLDEMEKMTTIDLMERSLRALAGAGIQTSTLWIAGYPGETEAEFGETLAFLERNRRWIYQADIWLFQFATAGVAGSGKLKADLTRSRFSAELNSAVGVEYSVPKDGVTPEERFSRLERFVRRMRELSIPNPYTTLQWIGADQRWTALGGRAVSPVSEQLMSLNS